MFFFCAKIYTIKGKNVTCDTYIYLKFSDLHGGVKIKYGAHKK